MARERHESEGWPSVDAWFDSLPVVDKELIDSLIAARRLSRDVREKAERANAPEPLKPATKSRKSQLGERKLIEGGVSHDSQIGL